MRRMLAFAGAACLAYAALVALLWWRQERLLFFPERLPPDYRFDLAADVHERSIDVPSAVLHALHLQLPAPRGVVFYLHGNAGSLRSWFADVDFYRRANFDLFMLDYRGYGKSSGHVDSEAQLHADVRAAWEQVAARYVGGRRVLLGRSLGSALAAQLALTVRPELTILVSPYTSVHALAAEHYPWVPGFALRYPLATDAALARLRTPVLLLHGERDTVIAPSHSLALQRANPAARLHVVNGAGHNDLDSFAEYHEVLHAALVAP